MHVCQEMLNDESDSFMEYIITDDQTRFPHYKLESKRTSVMITSDFPIKAKNTNCSHLQAKLRALFWDRKGVIFLDILKLGLTIKTDCYIASLTNLKSRISRFIPEKNTNICLQCNHARFHNSLETMDHIFCQTALPHAKYHLIWSLPNFNCSAQWKIDDVDSIFLTMTPSSMR